MQGTWVAGDVALDPRTGTVDAVGLEEGDPDRWAVPGFVDLQCNGFEGVDFAAAGPAELARLGPVLAAAGVTAVQPTLTTAPEAALLDALGRLGAAGDRLEGGPRVMGVHLEGPFLAPTRLGAHPAEHRRDPDLALLGRLLDGGPVTQLTMAPERPGGLDLLREARARGVTVSVGHSDATATEAHAAFDAGATTVTHLFNAMRPPAHRDPGVAYTALARRDVVVQIIADGVHLAPETVQMAFAAAPGRCAVVSDSVAAARRGGPTPRLAEGTLAGSALTMIDAVRFLVGVGCALEDALDAATVVPARVARRDDLGVLSPGGLADVIVIDADLAVLGTWVGARQLH